MSTDTKRPANLLATSVPIDGYILLVDGKLKTRYETSKEAVTAGAKLKDNFPTIQVAVYEATTRTYTPVNLPEK
jgi:hypothetical protein